MNIVRWALHRDARELIIVCLLILLGNAAISYKMPAFLIPSLVSVAAAVVTELVLFQLVERRLYTPKSAVITGLLIGMIIHPAAPLTLFVAIPPLVMAGKYLLKLLRLTPRHIFNPAASGVLLAQLLFGITPAWWAVGQEGLLVPLVLIGGVGFVLWRLGRLWLPIVFSALYGITLAVAFRSPAVAPFLVDGTLLLFSLVMLPEPQTSPVEGLWRYAFGALVALFVIILLALPAYRFDVLLSALLAADLVSFVMRIFAKEIRFAVSGD